MLQQVLQVQPQTGNLYQLKVQEQKMRTKNRHQAVAVAAVAAVTDTTM